MNTDPITDAAREAAREENVSSMDRIAKRPLAAPQGYHVQLALDSATAPLREEVAVLKSQVENADVTLEQVRLALRSRFEPLDAMTQALERLIKQCDDTDWMGVAGEMDAALDNARKALAESKADTQPERTVKPCAPTNSTSPKDGNDAVSTGASVVPSDDAPKTEWKIRKHGTQVDIVCESFEVAMLHYQGNNVPRKITGGVEEPMCGAMARMRARHRKGKNREYRKCLACFELWDATPETTNICPKCGCKESLYLSDFIPDEPFPAPACEMATPRTDAAIESVSSQNRLSPHVSAKFARQLERELTSALAERDEERLNLDQTKGELWQELDLLRDGLRDCQSAYATEYSERHRAENQRDTALRELAEAKADTRRLDWVINHGRLPQLHENAVGTAHATLRDALDSALSREDGKDTTRP